MKVEELLSRRNMRVFNLAAIALVTIAWGIRFYYFKEHEEVVENEIDVEVSSGTSDSNLKTVKLEKETVQDGFWMVMFTLFVFPCLIFIFIMQEFQVKGDWHGPIYRSYYFLDYYIGKGFYLLLLVALILQHRDVAQYLIVCAIMIVIAADFIYPCLLTNEPINGESAMVMIVMTDKNILNEL